MPGRSEHRKYPRTLRVNELLREILAEELELLQDDDERLGMLTVTGVDTERDLRQATVYLSSLSDEAAAALLDHRHRLQTAIARQVRLKRTPQLSFTADPAVSHGARVDELLRGLTLDETHNDDADD
jgi:ribosome-binding factor A